MKKTLSIFILLLAAVCAIFASNTQVNGIWYDFNSSSKKASVTYRGDYITQYTNNYNGAITIPSSVKYNGITYSVTSIGDWAFYGCSGMTSVTIPNSIASIGVSAFSGCSSLTSITIPNNVTSIGNYAFVSCSNLISITIPKNVTSIGIDAFMGCTSLISVVWNAKNCASAPTQGQAPFRKISSQITSFTFGNEVEFIPNHLCVGMDNLLSITIPSSVTNIEHGSYSGPFTGCTNLTTVTINSIAIISSNYTYGDNIYTMFGYASAQYIIGTNVTSIGEYAFCNSSGSTSITIPNGVTNIGAYAFRNCSGLTAMTIPNSVTSIGEYAFYNCSGLTSITIPNSITSIGEGVFRDCSGLISVTIPNSVTSIGEYAFYNCDGLTSITIPNSVTSIGAYAFDDCDGLTSITIPNSVTSIGSSAFSSPITSVTLNSDALVSSSYTATTSFCTKFGYQVTEYIIGEDVTSIGEFAFYDCKKITSLTIGENVTIIGYHAFSECKGLTNITIPDNVINIGGGAFSFCDNLTTVIIGDGVSDIGWAAFNGCNGLMSIAIYAEIPPTLGGLTFDNTNNCPIYVPCGTVSAYKSTWSDYSSRIHGNTKYTITTESDDENQGTATVEQ